MSDLMWFSFGFLVGVVALWRTQAAIGKCHHEWGVWSPHGVTSQERLCRKCGLREID